MRKKKNKFGFLYSFIALTIFMFISGNAGLGYYELTGCRFFSYMFASIVAITFL